MENVDLKQQFVVVHCVEITFDEFHPYESIGEYDDLLEKISKDTCFFVSPDCLLDD